MGLRVAILQSNYIPWKGYFDIINSVDLFVFHDDLQYTKSDWRNRNKIKTQAGPTWLTVPCGTNEKRLICDVALTDHEWQRKHWRLIVQNYRRATYFEYCSRFLEQFYLAQDWTNLSEMNQYFIRSVCRLLDMPTAFDDSRRYRLESRNAARVMDLLQQVGATSYLSGPAARAYLDENDFMRAGIALKWMDYSHYPEYSQFFAPFDHSVSIIDLLCHTGPNFRKYMKSFLASPPH